MKTQRLKVYLHMSGRETSFITHRGTTLKQVKARGLRSFGLNLSEVDPDHWSLYAGHCCDGSPKASDPLGESVLLGDLGLTHFTIAYNVLSYTDSDDRTRPVSTVEFRDELLTKYMRQYEQAMCDDKAFLTMLLQDTQDWNELKECAIALRDALEECYACMADIVEHIDGSEPAEEEEYTSCDPD